MRDKGKLIQKLNKGGITRLNGDNMPGIKE
jgi:hypothetical protein